MKKYTNLEIELIACSNMGGGDQGFYSINKTSFLHPEDSFPSKFWGISGGIEIVVDGYFSIYRSTQYYLLVSVADFLLTTLYNLKPVVLDTEKAFFNAYPQDIIDLESVDVYKSILRFEKNDNSSIKLSRFPSMPTIKEMSRYPKFFDNVIIDSDVWARECAFALDDYFNYFDKTVLGFFAKQEQTDAKKIDLMKRYVEMWYMIKKQL